MTTPPAAFRELLANSIDYAGLFPPASLPLEAALRNQATYVRSSEAGMLGAFVLPVTQFDAVTPFAAQFDAKHPLRISALGTRSDGADDFRKQLGEIVRAISALASRHSERVRVEQVEMPLPPDADADMFRDAENMLISTGCHAFWEAPLAGALAAIYAIARHRVRHSALKFGFKLRTGGTVAEAFPTPTQVAQILVAAAKDNDAVPVFFSLLGDRAVADAAIRGLVSFDHKDTPKRLLNPDFENLKYSLRGILNRHSVRIFLIDNAFR